MPRGPKEMTRPVELLTTSARRRCHACGRKESNLRLLVFSQTLDQSSCGHGSEGRVMSVEYLFLITHYASLITYMRRGRDSNPRSSSDSALATRRDQPLCH